MPLDQTEEQIRMRLEDLYMQLMQPTQYRVSATEVLLTSGDISQDHLAFHKDWLNYSDFAVQHSHHSGLKEKALVIMMMMPIFFIT